MGTSPHSRLFGSIIEMFLAFFRQKDDIFVRKGAERTMNFLKNYAKDRNVSVYLLIEIMLVPKSSGYKMVKRPDLIPAYALSNLEMYFKDRTVYEKFKLSIPKRLKYEKLR